jgi:hypothetical protein
MGTVGTFSGFFAFLYFAKLLILLAPEVGLEPTTLRLTAECSAIELLRSVLERERNASHASIFIANGDMWVKGIGD